ncbi:drug/metabolite transporter (DMT)-like permease [Thermolongibacillus altinsuensis]|jgi:drug/metabolite transporter (DMT)-like permease|uniref:Drug/metabolite transporter (DMT)-like permease n=1 Tax=Thermolongibacillus altinsuensis TaxID=575256 RepID=A0A4R1QDQ4_9BACL|nr:DMT family transporter [Thermolongibacillus altinsuensis]TCL48083.1 drug/metabolite transporter (DMT)-like permease [Thermolongibacillus altinsuensis]
MTLQQKADVSLLFVAFVWGATFVVVQNAIAFLPPLLFNGIRFLLASLFLWTWLFLFERKRKDRIDRELVFAGVKLGIWLFAGYALQTIGLLYTTSSKAGFITGLSVVLVPFFSFLLLKQKPSINALLGTGVAAVGLYFLTMNGSMSINKGDLFVFFCAISFALHIVLTGKYASRYSTLSLTTIQIQTVAFLCFLFSLFLEDWKTLSYSLLLQLEVWTALIITALFATTVAFFIQTNFQKYTSPTRVALIFAMEPVFAALTAYIWNDERLHHIAILGAFLIFLGMILSELPQNVLNKNKSARGL